jgi:hypothetical protein
MSRKECRKMKRLLAGLILVTLLAGCKPPEGTTPVDHSTLPDELGVTGATHVVCARLSGKGFASYSMMPLRKGDDQRILRTVRRLKCSHKAEHDYLGLPPGQMSYRYYRNGKPNGPWLCEYIEHVGIRRHGTSFRAFYWKEKERKVFFTYYMPKTVNFFFGGEESKTTGFWPKPENRFPFSPLPDGPIGK